MIKITINFTVGLWNVNFLKAFYFLAVKKEKNLKNGSIRHPQVA